MHYEASATRQGFWEKLQRGLRPTTGAVMLEDGAAVTGLVIGVHVHVHVGFLEHAPVCAHNMMYEGRGGPKKWGT